MNTKNKSQIEVKSIQYKERSYYEWGCNMKSRYLSKGLDYEVTIKKRPNYCPDIALLSRL